MKPPTPQKSRKVDQTAIAQERLRRALAYHRAGSLAQAQELYEAVLHSHPDQYDATRLMGIIAYQRDDNARAIEWFTKAIRLEPANAAVYMDLGNALKRAGEYRAALLHYDRAIALRPEYPEAYTNRGNTLFDCGEFASAVASYEKALAINPAFAQAHYGRARASRELGRLADAVAGYERAIACKPDYVEALYDRGNALHDLGRHEDAVASYDQVLAINPTHAEAHNNRGNAMLALRREEDAFASYAQAVAIDPANAQAQNNLGKLLQARHQLDLALARYDTALRLAPGLAEAHNNRGNVLAEMKRLDESLASYDRGLAVHPADPELHWNKALLLLLAGDFKRGWPLYEWRWKRTEFATRKRPFSQPVWLGDESLEGKTILLHNEQGLGDLIQFCRYAKWVAARGAKVVLEVPRQMMGLLSKLEGVHALVATGDPLPPFDFHCSVLSLPLALERTLCEIPAMPRYLRSDEATKRRWERCLGLKELKRVGLVWSGSAGHGNDHNRSIPLSLLAPHLPKDCEYVSLQRELREGDRETLSRLPQIRYVGDDISDFSDTAALCDLMDCVISVDTSVAHLAGALGKNAYVLLPFHPDWRWLLDRFDSPWYPSVRLVRQQASGDWGSALKILHEMLNQPRSIRSR